MTVAKGGKPSSYRSISSGSNWRRTTSILMSNFSPSMSNGRLLNITGELIEEEITSAEKIPIAQERVVASRSTRASKSLFASDRTFLTARAKPSTYFVQRRRPANVVTLAQVDATSPFPSSPVAACQKDLSNRVRASIGGKLANLIAPQCCRSALLASGEMKSTDLLLRATSFSVDMKMNFFSLRFLQTMRSYSHSFSFTVSVASERSAMHRSSIGSPTIPLFLMTDANGRNIAPRHASFSGVLGSSFAASTISRVASIPTRSNRCNW